VEQERHVPVQWRGEATVAAPGFGMHSATNIGRDYGILAADIELLDDRAIPRLVLRFHIIKQRAALRNHLEQPAT
jgi:hypothetical protein